MSEEHVWSHSIQLDEFAAGDEGYLESLKNRCKLDALKQILTLLGKGEPVTLRMKIDEPHEDWREMVSEEFSSACVWRCSIYLLVDD